jgi:hypothetical protein
MAWRDPTPQEDAMTDPAGSDRIQQDVPTASGTGDNSDSGTDSFADVPLTRDEAIARDSAQDDDLPARADGDVARARGAGASGEVEGSGPRYDDRTRP